MLLRSIDYQVTHIHTKKDILLSKKTIYLLIRIYKAVAEVTECHSGSEQGSFRRKTGLPSHNIKLIEIVRKIKVEMVQTCMECIQNK